MINSVLAEARIMGFIPSSKPDEAKKFYSEMLGLDFFAEDEYGLMFSINNTSTLRVQKARDWKPQPFTIFGWEVENISGAVQSLIDRGVKFENFGFPSQDAQGICTFENGDQVAWFKDPDGNTLSIAQLVRK